MLVLAATPVEQAHPNAFISLQLTTYHPSIRGYSELATQPVHIARLDRNHSIRMPLSWAWVADCMERRKTGGDIGCILVSCECNSQPDRPHLVKDDNMQPSKSEQ